MGEYISREAAIKALEDQKQCVSSDTDRYSGAFVRAVIDTGAMVLRQLPAADVVNAGSGSWEPEGYVDEDKTPPRWRRIGYRCSRCGWSNAIKTRYCGRCGARMDKEA